MQQKQPCQMAKLVLLGILSIWWKKPRVGYLLVWTSIIMAIYESDVEMEIDKIIYSVNW